MKKVSFCIWLMMLPTLILGGQVGSECGHRPWTTNEIDNAWIRVPWTHGGYYYHNTLTRDDQDNPPNCVSGNCKWSWD